MNTTSRRLALWLIAALLCTLFYIKSRAPRLPVGGTAFFSFSDTGIMVKINGKVPSPGMYRLNSGITIGSVISLTFSDSTDYILTGSSPGKILQQGDTVTVVSRNLQHVEITLSRMTAKEMILLNIPLQPDCMAVEDWATLPGIGPAFAKKIIADRQQNGDYHSIQSLQRVPGIGKEKLRLLKPFF